MPGGIANCGGCASAATLTGEVRALPVYAGPPMGTAPALLATVEGNEPGGGMPALPASPCTSCGQARRWIGLLVVALVVYTLVKR